MSEEIEAATVLKGEAMLLGWNQSHNRGSTVTILVTDEDLEQFKLLTVAKGKVAGQRFMYAFAPIGDDEKPMPLAGKPKGGALSQLAAQWCRDPQFQEWICNAFGSIAISAGEAPEEIRYEGEQGATQLLRNLCGIESRAELDNNILARAAFEQRVRQPYRTWLAQQ